jgi:polyferredoxin
VPPRADRRLKLLRYVALAASLAFTYKLGELVLRGFDPFYVVFSGFGHGTIGWVSVAVLGAIAAGSIVIPMFFCKYLCPLGATLDPASRLGLIKIVRDDANCTQCGDCASACPHGIEPFAVNAVRHRDCTNCLECVEACPVEGTLELRATLWGPRNLRGDSTP